MRYATRSYRETWTFTIFLATIIVLKGIDTTTNGAPNATNTSRPRDSSQVPIVHFLLLIFFILLISISNYRCKIYLATTTISTRNAHRSITPPANQSAMTTFRSHRLGLLRSRFCSRLCDVPTLHHRPSPSPHTTDTTCVHAHATPRVLDVTGQVATSPC